MSPRPRKVQDADVFAALARVMHRRGPGDLTLREIAAEAGVTAGALVQRFGSKRALLLAHARHVAGTADRTAPTPRPRSPLQALRALPALYARAARSPQAALRNLAYLQNDLADPVLYRHLLKMSRTARRHYDRLVADAVAAAELRADTDVRALGRAIEVALRGSFLNWLVYRDGPAADWLRSDMEATLRPYLAGGARQRE